MEEAKLKLIEHEQRNTDLQNRRYEVRRRIQTSEEKIIQYTERKGEAERRIKRALHEIEEAGVRIEKITGRISGARVEEDVTSEKIVLEREEIKNLGGTEVPKPPSSILSTESGSA